MYSSVGRCVEDVHSKFLKAALAKRTRVPVDKSFAVSFFSQPFSEVSRRVQRVWAGSMGKIHGGGLEDVKVKVKRGNASQSVCSAETVGFLTCLDQHNGNEQQCLGTKRALFDCMQMATASGAMQQRHKVPINYHIRTVRCPVLSPSALLDFFSQPMRVPSAAYPCADARARVRRACAPSAVFAIRRIQGEKAVTRPARALSAHSSTLCDSLRRQSRTAMLGSSAPVSSLCPQKPLCRFNTFLTPGRSH